MRSEEDIYKRYSNIAVIFFIFPLAAFFIFKDFLNITEEARISAEVWKNNFVKHGISSFTFVTDTIYYETDYHGAAWTELKKLYINGHLANPDTLYEKKDLLIYHCGKYFFSEGQKKTPSVMNFLLKMNIKLMVKEFLYHQVFSYMLMSCINIQMIYRIVTKLKDRNNFDLAIAWQRFTDVAYNALGPLGGVVLELIRQKIN